MNWYDETYDQTWDDLEKDDATERAYAIGVAERLGEYNREELKAILDAMTTAYERSIVELAYEEGRREAAEVARGDVQDRADVWETLIEGETIDIDPEPELTGGRDGLPEALDSTEILDLPHRDSTDATKRPEFLDR